MNYVQRQTLDEAITDIRRTHYYGDYHEADRLQMNTLEYVEGVIVAKDAEIERLRAKDAAYGITQSLAEVLLKIDLTAISPVEALTRLSELKHTVKNMLAKTGGMDVS